MENKSFRLSHLTLRITGIFAVIVSLLHSSVSAAYDASFYQNNDVLYFNPIATACSSSAAADTLADATNFGTISVPKDFTLGKDKGLRPVNLLKQLMQDFNFKDYQAAGIVGNFMHESGGQHLPPNINELSYPGGGAGPPNFMGGYGWAQWTGGRQTGFIAFAVEKGYMASKNVDATDAANYAWLVYELTKGDEQKTVPAIKATKTVLEASQQFEHVFERAGVVANASRDGAAQRVLAAYKKNGSVAGISGSTEDTTSSQAVDCIVPESVGGSGMSGEFGEITFPLKGTKKTVLNRNSLFANGKTRSDFHKSPTEPNYLAYDIYAKAGTPVVAFASGTVTNISSVGSMGGGISIFNQQANGGKGLVVYYTHMYTLKSLKIGDKINPGDSLGTLVAYADFPDINTDHLHIDASKSRVRQSCSRGSGSPACSLTVDIGQDLYSTYQKLPN